MSEHPVQKSHRTPGRAAGSNPDNRFDQLHTQAVDDGWARDHDLPVLRTEVSDEVARTVISRNTSPDLSFDRSINPYRGCEHGCIYCFARPSHAYHDLSPGLDFETKLFAKPGAADPLRETLAKRNYKPRAIAMGTNTDPYQPIERDYRITRQLLEVCLEARHPVTITTKSDRAVQDADLLEEMARKNLVAVAISVTTLDPVLSNKLEPRCAAPAKRIAALKRLVELGVPTHCSISPIIPAITDEFMEAIVAHVAEIGVPSVGWIPLRLPHEVAPLFREWLDVHYPDRAGKVMSIVRSIRNGRDNDPDFFSRMQPTGVWADLLRSRFRIACKRAGFGKHRFELDCSRFRPPEVGGQMRLF